MTSEALNSFTPIEKSKVLYDGARSFAMNTRGDSALLGGKDGRVGVYSMFDKAIVQEMNVGHGSITDALWIGDRVAASTSTGHVRIWENGTELADFSGHAGEVTALALHPSGDILASVGVDKSYIFYDLTTRSIAVQILTNSGKAQKDPTMNSPATDTIQHLLPLVFIQTATCSLLGAWIVKSKYSMSRARPMPRISILQVL